jgi:glycosyltransferase involved in cell wall biosynthesis
MRILHLTNHVLEVGNGIVNVAVDLAHGQAAEGHQVGFGSSGGGYEALLAEGGVEHFRLGIPGASLPGLAAPAALWRCLRRFKPDIVHAHMVKWAALARAFEPFHRYATVATVHNVYQRSSRAMGACDGIVALGEASRSIILGWGVAPEKVHVVVNAPLGTPRLPSASSVEPFRMESPSIVSVGGLFQRKGFGTLIEAFGSVLRARPTATLHIVGEGPDRPLFEAAAARVAPDRIFFHGFQAEPRPFLKGADVVVLASTRESFPLVLLEAREFGSRIVATDVDGNREALDGGAAGWLVPSEDPVSLGAAILRAIDSTIPDGTTNGLDRYRVPALVERTSEIYAAALERRRR